MQLIMKLEKILRMMFKMVTVIMLWCKAASMKCCVFEGQRRAEDLQFVDMCERIIELVKNNVSQPKIGEDLHISPSAVRNIIKPFKEACIAVTTNGIEDPKTKND